MKQLLFLAFFLIAGLLFSQQEEQKFSSLEISVFQGNILEHNSSISHLITGHPTGFIFSYNRKTYGFKEWERRYNYPDWGFTFAYQDMKNPYLGDNYSLYGHYNFYYFKRRLSFGIGTGIAYNTNPYDSETNYQNNAYGSTLLNSTFFRLNYTNENIYRGLGISAGIGLIHYSNANFKAPNTSTNTIFANITLSYFFNQENFPEHIIDLKDTSKKYSENIAYNIVLRTGINEADVNGLGQFPFFVFSAFVDKKISYKSTFQAGFDVFFSGFLEELIKYRSIVFPEDGITGNEDYRRIGVFIGYELRVNKNALVTQLGYYVYWPYKFENRVYNRIGYKRYFLRNKLFATVSLHAHWAKAEAVEFGVGVRL